MAERPHSLLWDWVCWVLAFQPWPDVEPGEVRALATPFGDLADELGALGPELAHLGEQLPTVLLGDTGASARDNAVRLADYAQSLQGLAVDTQHKLDGSAEDIEFTETQIWTMIALNAVLFVVTFGLADIMGQFLARIGAAVLDVFFNLGDRILARAVAGAVELGMDGATEAGIRVGAEAGSRAAVEAGLQAGTKLSARQLSRLGAEAGARAAARPAAEAAEAAVSQVEAAAAHLGERVSETAIADAAESAATTAGSRAGAEAGAAAGAAKRTTNQILGQFVRRSLIDGLVRQAPAGAMYDLIPMAITGQWDSEHWKRVVFDSVTGALAAPLTLGFSGAGRLITERTGLAQWNNTMLGKLLLGSESGAINGVTAALAMPFAMQFSTDLGLNPNPDAPRGLFPADYGTQFLHALPGMLGRSALVESARSLGMHGGPSARLESFVQDRLPSFQTRHELAPPTVERLPAPAVDSPPGDRLFADEPPAGAPAQPAHGEPAQSQPDSSAASDGAAPHSQPDGAPDRPADSPVPPRLAPPTRGDERFTFTDRGGQVIPQRGVRQEFHYLPGAARDTLGPADLAPTADGRLALTAQGRAKVEAVVGKPLTEHGATQLERAAIAEFALERGVHYELLPEGGIAIDPKALLESGVVNSGMSGRRWLDGHNGILQALEAKHGLLVRDRPLAARDTTEHTATADRVADSAPARETDRSENTVERQAPHDVGRGLGSERPAHEHDAAANLTVDPSAVPHPAPHDLSHLNDESLQKAYSPRAEAELARRRGKDDVGGLLDRIADRYHPGEGERGLHELDDHELMHLLLTGDHETALAAVYELIRAHEGKALRWTQLEAPIALLDGQHIQMDAGEGKSLALLAATARKATEGAADGAGKWVQLITTRDALADREIEVFTKVFGDHGIDVVRMSPDGVSQPLQQGKPTILIGTHEDAAFSDLSGKPTPGDWAIIDEGDDAFYYTNSTFIRQEGAQLAATPEEAAAVLSAHDFLHGLLRDGALTEGHFGREPGQRGGPARIDDAGKKMISKRLGRPLTEEESNRFDMAATAHFEYAENIHYVIDPVHGRVLIIDQITGKVMFDPRTSSESRWNGGLAQALEAKHGLGVRAEADSPKETSMGELFGTVGGDRRFENVVTASGTNQGKEEIYRELGLSDRIATIERYHELRLEVTTDKVFANEADKHLQIARDTAEMQKTGRPQYIVAIRNDEVATISRLLTEMGVEHTWVDAKWWVDKANQGADAMREFQQIVKAAGDTGKVTIVTMAGARGLDPGQGDQGLGGLMVRATARSAISHDLDIQLQNRAGRSGEKGGVQFYVSPEDHLFALSHNELVRTVTVQYVEATRAEATAGAHAAAAEGLRAVIPLAQHDAQNRTLEQFRRQLLQRRHDIGHGVNLAGTTGQAHPAPAHDTQADDGPAYHREAAGPEPDRAADTGTPAGRHAWRTVIGPLAQQARTAQSGHAAAASDQHARDDGANQQLAAKHGDRADYRGAYTPARAQRDPLPQLRGRAREEAAALPPDAPPPVRDALSDYRRAVDDLRRLNGQARVAEAADPHADRPGDPAMLAFTTLVAAVRTVSASAARYAATARSHGLDTTLDRDGDLLDPERANTDAVRLDRDGRFTLLTRARIAAGHPYPAAGLVRRAFLTTPLTEAGADTVGPATRRRLQPMIEDPRRPAVLDRHGTQPDTWRPFVFPEMTQTALDLLFVHENAHTRITAADRGVAESPRALGWKRRSLTAAQQEEAACEIAEYAYCARVAREARRRGIDPAAALPAPALRLLGGGSREVTRRATAADPRPQSRRHRRGKDDPLVWQALHELRGGASSPAGPDRPARPGLAAEQQPTSTSRSPFTPDAGALAGLDAGQRADLTAALFDLGRDAAALVRHIVEILPPDTLTGVLAGVDNALHRLLLALSRLTAEHASRFTTEDLRVVNDLRARIDVPITLVERHSDGPYHALRSALDALAASIAAAHQQRDESAGSAVAPARHGAGLASLRTAVATFARSVADRATGLATAPGAHAELARSVAAAAELLAARPVDAPRAAAVQARLRGLQRMLSQLEAALVASPSDENVLAQARNDLQQALHQLNLASGRYEELRARAEDAVAGATRETQRWGQQLLVTTVAHADPVVAAYRDAADVQRLSDELAGRLAGAEPAAAAVVEPLVAALDRLAAATEALTASSPPIGPVPALPAELTELLTEATKAVSFAQRERAWRQTRIVHSAADLDELWRIAGQQVQAAALLAAQLDALYVRVDAARRALTERADLDSLADGQALVTPAELALLERVIPAGLLAEMVTALGRYRYRRDHGLLELGHLGGQDPLSQTLLASRDNVRALRRRIEELSNELAGARRRGTPTAILRYRLNLLLDSHNAQLPVLVRDIDSELETVRRKRDVFAAAGNRAAVERLQWWRDSLNEERGRALARIDAVRRNEKRLTAARRRHTTAAAVLYTSYRDLVGIERFLRGLDAAQMAPSPGLFGLDRHIAGLLEPFGAGKTTAKVDALGTRTGLPADVIVDVSTDTQSVDDLRRAYVALHRAQDEQQAVFDDPARRSALDADLDPTRRVIDGVNLIAAFQSAYEQSRATVDAALAEAEGLAAAEASASEPRLVELAVVVGEEMARTRFLAWLWRRGADRLWTPADDRQVPAALVALVNESLPDLGSDVRADVVAAIQVCEYLAANGLELTGLQGAAALHDVLRAADSPHDSDLALPRLRDLVLRRLKELKRTSPVETAAHPELRMISHELAKAISHRPRHQAYLSRLGGGEQAAAALKAIEDGLAVRVVHLRQALAQAEGAAAPAAQLVQLRNDLRAFERRLAGVLLRRLRLLDAELRQIRDDGLLPDDVAVAELDGELRRAERLDHPLADLDVADRPLRVLFAAVQRLDGLWLRSSRGWRPARDERVARAAARTAAPNLDRGTAEPGRPAQVPPGYSAALRARLAEPARDLLAIGAEWNRAQRQRQTYLVQLSELARDVGLLLHGLHQPDAPQARQEMLRERIGRRQEALAQWTLHGPSAQPIPPDPAEVATSLPAPARHLPGSDPLMGAGVLSPELGVNPFEWPGVVVGVNARVVSSWEPLTYDVRRTSFPNVIGGPLMVTVSASRDWQIDYHGATLRVRETRRSTTILEGPLMMGRAGAALSPGSLGSDVFGSPIDLPGSYPANENQPPGAPPHLGALPTAVPIPLRLHGHEVGGVLVHVVFRAPYLAWETSFLPTDFHQFDHVDAVDLVVVKQRSDNGDPLPDLPDRWVVQAPAVDIASTGSPRHRLDLQTKAGVGFDTLLLLQLYVGDSTQGLDSIMTLATVGGVLQAQITTEPKFSVEGTDVGLGVEWLWAAFVSAGIGIKSLPYVLVPELLPAGFWSAIGGVGVSGVPFNHVRGRSLMPLVRFLQGRMLRRIGAAQRRLFYDWMRQQRQTGSGRIGSIARRGAEWVPIMGPVLRTARTGAAQAQARLAIDTRATMVLAELRGQAIEERVAGAALASGSVPDNARRLSRHIEASGLLRAGGPAGRAAAAAHAAARSAVADLPDGIRDLSRAVADQLAQLRQVFDRLAVAHTSDDDAAAEVAAAAERLSVQTARGAAARAIERAMDAVLNLERALPALPATAELTDLRERIASWAQAATERLLAAAGAVDEPDAYAPAAMVRLPDAAAAVAARLDHLAELIARAAGPGPQRRALRWARAAAELRPAVVDIEPLTELDRLLTGARSEPARPPAVAPSAAPPSGPAQLPALRAAVRKPDFQLGMSVTAAALADDATARHVAREAAAVTTQDALAWSTVRPDQTHVAVHDLDAVVAFAAAHGLPVHAHALISPGDLPSWLLTGDHTPSETAAIMRDHITRLVGAYRGRVRRWTVVDQALSDTGALRDSLWRVRVGRHYVSDAFRAAAAADPAAVLYLTDHDVAGENPDKTEQFFQLVSALRREGAPMHGVGVRLRLAVRRGPDGVPFVDWTPAAVRVNLRRLAAMGLEVAIAGVDVRLPARPSATDLAVQAQAFAEVVRISQEIDGIASLTLWGASDGHSAAWNRFPGTGSATPFRADLTPKPAVGAMLAVLRSSATGLPGERAPGAEGGGTKAAAPPETKRGDHDDYLGPASPPIDVLAELERRLTSERRLVAGRSRLEQALDEVAETLGLLRRTVSVAEHAAAEFAVTARPGDPAPGAFTAVVEAVHRLSEKVRGYAQSAGADTTFLADADLLDPGRAHTYQAALIGDGSRFHVLTLAIAAVRLDLDTTGQGRLLLVAPLSPAGVAGMRLGAAQSRRLHALAGDPHRTVAAFDQLTGRTLIMPGTSQTGFESMFVHESVHGEFGCGALSPAVAATRARAAEALPDLAGHELEEAVALAREAEYLEQVVVAAGVDDPAYVVPRADLPLLEHGGWPEITRRIAANRGDRADDLVPGGGDDAARAPGAGTFEDPIRNVTTEPDPIGSAGDFGSEVALGDAYGARRAHLPGVASPVVVKQYPDGPGVRSLIEADITVGRIAWAAGVGVPVYGVVELPETPDGTPVIGFAMGEAPGGFFEESCGDYGPAAARAASANARNITDQTYVDIATYRDALTDRGFEVAFDIQGFVGPHGRWRPIDFAARPAPGRTLARVAAHNEWVFGKYLAEVRAAQAAVDSGIFGGHVIDPPTTAPQLRNVVQAAAGVRRLGAGVPGVSAIDPEGPGRLLVTTECGRRFHVLVVDDPGSVPTHLEELYATERGRPYAIAAITAGRIAERVALQNAVDAVAAVDAMSTLSPSAVTDHVVMAHAQVLGWVHEAHLGATKRAAFTALVALLQLPDDVVDRGAQLDRLALLGSQELADLVWQAVTGTGPGDPIRPAGRSERPVRLVPDAMVAQLLRPPWAAGDE